MANSKLISELKKGAIVADQKGYYKARGFDKFPGWDKLPFADFFENLSSSKGHKKMWMNPDGTFRKGRTSFECDSLIPLYGGIVDTQRIIVSAGFFTYSALVVSLHLALAYWSRKLGVEPNVTAIIESENSKAIRDISERALATRISAFIIYEGDGLGGYSTKVWKLWGRIYGMPCPTDRKVLSQEEAMECCSAWKDANPEQQKALFVEWWNEIDESHSSIPNSIIGRIYTAYSMVRRYQQMESPHVTKKTAFNPESTTDCQAAICGFFRRSAKGLSEANAYDSNDIENPANRFSDMISIANEKVERMLSGKDGLTPFGQYIMDVWELNSRRTEITDGITKRQSESEEKQMKYLREGFKLQLSKKGRARF